MDTQALLYLKWVTNKDLSYGTQLSVMCQPGQEGVWQRMDMCIGLAESLHCSPEAITTLVISYTPMQNKNFKKKNMINYDTEI